MLKRTDAIEKRRARDRRYKWRRAHGRLALPGFHVSDVDWPEKLVALGRLRRDQVDDRVAITTATIAFLDDIALAEIADRRR